MNKLLEAAKAVLNQYSKSRSYLSADIDSDVMEALRQAVNEAERKQALTELTKLSQELGLYE